MQNRLAICRCEMGACFGEVVVGDEIALNISDTCDMSSFYLIKFFYKLKKMQYLNSKV